MTFESRRHESMFSPENHEAFAAKLLSQMEDLSAEVVEAGDTNPELKDAMLKAASVSDEQLGSLLEILEGNIPA